MSGWGCRCVFAAVLLSHLVQPEAAPIPARTFRGVNRVRNPSALQTKKGRTSCDVLVLPT